MSEEWRPVLSFEGLYEISSYGRVRSLPHRVPTMNGTFRTTSGRVMKQDLVKVGYYRVCLCSENKKYNKLVHRLMAEAFIPKIEGKGCVNHRDGVKTNNALDNLEWASYSDNTQHAMRTGLLVHPKHDFCQRGHAFTEDNSYFKKGGRECRKCRRENGRRYYQANKIKWAS